MTTTAKKTELEEIEVALLLEGLHRRYGIDLRDYEHGFLQWGIRECMLREGVTTVSRFQEKVLRETESLERLLLLLVSKNAGLFRDPSFFVAFRAKVVPLLRTYPFVRIWLAGCSTGEEVYSIAIMLEEEGLYPRSRIYATEFSREAVRRAREGVFPLSAALEYMSNYLRAGGLRYLSDYYTIYKNRIIFDPALRKNVTFSEHNLATDGSFNEFHVVLCRSGMVHFNPNLQERIHELFYESLGRFGVIGLGKTDSLKFSGREAFYEVIDDKNRLYRKID